MSEQILLHPEREVNTNFRKHVLYTLVTQNFNVVHKLNQESRSPGVNLKITKLAILPLLTAAALRAAALQLA